ncbi:hypothetical protein ACJ5M8_000699 [Vibrio antiquarius]
MKNNNKEETPLPELTKLFPELSVSDIKRLRSTFGSIKHRCGRAKNYKNVKCEFTLKTYLAFIVDEINKGRDFRTMKSYATARIHDNGHYSPDNCRITTRAKNTIEGNAKPIVIYDSLTGEQQTYMHGLNHLYKINADKFKISKSTFYRYVAKNKQIYIYGEDDQELGFIKISFL